MADAKNKLEQQLEKLLNTKANNPIRYNGLLGIYVDGIKTVNVPNRPNFVYVRINDGSEIVQAFNNTINGAFDLAVVIEKQTDLNYYRVVDIQIQKYQSMNNITFAPRHAQTHIFGGTDPIYIYKRQLLQPFGVAPTAPSSMNLQVFGDYYLWNGQISKLDNIITDDFTPYLPTGALNNKFVTIYVDGNINNLGYLAGSEFYNSFYSTGTDWYIPEVSPEIGIQIASVLLSTGTTSLGWNNIKDIRNFLNNNSASSAIAIHGLDPDLGYHSGSLQAKYVSVADIGNYYTGTNAEQILQEIGYTLNNLPAAGNAQLHGLYRTSIISGTINILLPDYVEYIDTVFINNILLDPLLYSLSSGSNNIILSSPIPYDANLVSNYVILQG